MPATRFAPMMIPLGESDTPLSWLETSETPETIQEGIYSQGAGWLANADFRGYAEDPDDASRRLFTLRGVDDAPANLDGIRYNFPDPTDDLWIETRLRFQRSGAGVGNGQKWAFLGLGSDANNTMQIGIRTKGNGAETMFILNIAGLTTNEDFGTQPLEGVWWYIRIRFRADSGVGDGLLQIAFSPDGVKWGKPLAGVHDVDEGVLSVDIQNHAETNTAVVAGPAINKTADAGTNWDVNYDYFVALQSPPSQSVPEVADDDIFGATLWHREHPPQFGPPTDDTTHSGRRKVHVYGWCDVGRFGAHDGVGGFLPVDALFELATDEAMTTLVRSEALPVDHANLHYVDNDFDDLPPNTTLYCRITWTVDPSGKATQFQSPVEPIKTLSTAGSPSPDPITVFLGSCNSFRPHASQETWFLLGLTPDVFLHLDDYNYPDSRSGGITNTLGTWRMFSAQHLHSQDWFIPLRGAGKVILPGDHPFGSAGGLDLSANQQTYILPTNREFVYSHISTSTKAPTPASLGESDQKDVGAHFFDTEMCRFVFLDDQRFRTNAAGSEKFIPDEWVTWAQGAIETDKRFIFLCTSRMQGDNELKQDKDWSNPNARPDLLAIYDHALLNLSNDQMLIAICGDHHVHVYTRKWVRSLTLSGSAPNKTVTLSPEEDARIGPEILASPLSFSNSPIIFDEANVGTDDDDTYMKAVRDDGGFVADANATAFEAGYVRLTLDEQARTVRVDYIDADFESQEVKFGQTLGLAIAAAARGRSRNAAALGVI